MKFDLSYYFVVLLRRLPIIIIVFLAATAISIVAAYRLSPVYESSARLMLENASIPDSLVAPTVDTAALEQLQIVEQRLTTRENLLDIAKKLQAVPKVATTADDDIVLAMLNATSIDLQAGRDQATLMSITFDASSGETAAAVVNEYVKRVLEDSAATRTNQAQDTMQFFRQEVDRLSTALSQQSAKILNFQKDNSDALPNALDFRLTQQANLQERLAAVDRQTADLKSQVERLNTVRRSPGQADPTDPATAQTPEAQQLAQLKVELAQALAVFAPTNPKVLLLKTQIAEFEARLNATQNAPVAGHDGTNTTAAEDTTPKRPLSPLDVHLADLQAQLTQLGLQHDEVTKQMDALKASIERSSNVAVLLQALQRDYDNTQSQYNTAIDRLSKASTGERIESLSKGQRIAVLDAATVPSAPVRPRRFRIAAMGSFAGLALGIGLIFLLELMNRSIRRPVDLERVLNITPIGTIPYTRTPGEAMKLRFVMALLLLAVVTGVPAGVYVVDRYFMPMDIILAKINSKLGL